MNTSFQQGNRVLFNSPAKINLFFRVLRKRPDSYHEIGSLYQAISLCDQLHFTLNDEDSLVCNDLSIPTDATNLVWKAIDCFRRKTGKQFKVRIDLIKRIPAQAGLGGGSGNAATALWAVNNLLGNVVSEEDLRFFASEFSSDAPFFFSSGTAYCSGRGEILETLPPLPGRNLWIAKPRDGLSTPLVYKHCKSELFPQRDPNEALQRILAGSSEYFNDLEISAFQLMPGLLILKEKLIDLGFSSVTMTGSGTAFFCFGDIKHPPFLEEVQFTPVHYLNRQEGTWYVL